MERCRTQNMYFDWLVTDDEVICPGWDIFVRVWETFPESSFLYLLLITYVYNALIGMVIDRTSLC